MQGKPVIRHRRKPVTAGGVLRALAILGYLIFALFPVFIMISISFTDKYSIMGLDTPLWPENPITRNYVRIWESIPLLRYSGLKSPSSPISAIPTSALRSSSTSRLPSERIISRGISSTM